MMACSSARCIEQVIWALGKPKGVIHHSDKVTNTYRFLTVNARLKRTSKPRAVWSEIPATTPWLRASTP